MKVRTTVAILACLLALVAWQTRDERGRDQPRPAVVAGNPGIVRAQLPGAVLPGAVLPGTKFPGAEAEVSGGAAIAALPGRVGDAVDLDLD